MRENGLDIGDSLTFYEDECKNIVSFFLYVKIYLFIYLLGFINYASLSQLKSRSIQNSKFPKKSASLIS